MSRDREVLRNRIRRDRGRRRSCTFLNPIRTIVFTERYSANDEKHHSQTDIHPISRSEKNALGREILDKWLLYKHGRVLWE